MDSLSPLRGSIRAAGKVTGWVASTTWGALKFTASWITSPTRIATTGLKIVGTGVVLHTVKKSYDDSRFFLGNSETTQKTDALANLNPLSGPPGCPDVNGLFSAMRNCPPPLMEGSYDCWGHGWKTSPIGQSTLGQVVEKYTVPFRSTVETGYQFAEKAANAARCVTTEKGTLNSIFCVLSGGDKKARAQIEDKTKIFTILFLAGLVWVLTRPREEDDENKKRA